MKLDESQEEEIEAKATTIVAGVILLSLLTGALGYLIGERRKVKDEEPTVTEVCKGGLESCRTGLIRCDARLTQLEQFLGLVAKNKPSGQGGTP